MSAPPHTSARDKGDGSATTFAEIHAMARSKLVGLVFEAWNDIDRVMAGLAPHEAVAIHEGGSTFAWTYAHVANQLDAWVNVQFAAVSPHALISRTQFRAGSDGQAEDWTAVQQAVAEVRADARAYLQGLDDADLDRTVPYDGSLTYLKNAGLSLRYALLRIAAHHYFHIGEIASKRDRSGHQVGDYPGALRECI
jgi:hypothetical protein